MNSSLVEKFDGSLITDEMLSDAANLFSANYGVWGPLAKEKMGVWAKQGARVKMSPKKLKGQILSEHGHANNVYIRLTINGNLAGNVFGTRWIYQGHPVLWITQLCVHTSYRNRGIAKQLLGTLYQGEHCVGILSSHPFAICAALRIFGSGVEIVKPDLEMTRNEVKGVMESCPVGYVKDSKLHGTLWDAGI